MNPTTVRAGHGRLARRARAPRRAGLGQWAGVALLSALASGLGGCAFEAGDPFGRVSGDLDARYQLLADRAAGEGFEKLASDFQIRVTRAALTIDGIELVDSGTGANAATFDPANPPAGYSLCHNGHCHADDGSLVSYEDVAAELALGGGTDPTTVAVLTAGVVDLLGPGPTALGCTPSCGLPEGYLVLARLTSSRLELGGELRDARSPARIAGVVDWQVDLSLLDPPPGSDADDAPAGSFELRLDAPIGEDEPIGLDLHFALPTSAKLLDRVDFSAVEPGADGGLDLGGPSGETARAALAESFAALEPRVDAARTED